MAKSDERQINKINKKRRRSRLNPYITLTVDEALMTLTEEQSTIGRLNRLQVIKDLEVSPSSSSSTITQDERTENMDIDIPITVYGAFYTSKD